MNPSEILQKDHEDMLRLCQRMKPEERLVAFFHHTQLTYQMYRAGVRYRSGSVPPPSTRDAEQKP